MKRKHKIIFLAFFSITVVTLVVAMLLRANTRKHSPADTVALTGEGWQITVNYCRPYKKGRLIFGPEEEGALQPFGRYWRLGANEATTLEITHDAFFAGQPLPAGRYSVYAVPGPETWVIGINKEADRWGYAEPDYELDLLRVEVPVTWAEEAEEQFTIMLQSRKGGALMRLSWDKARLEIPITFAGRQGTQGEGLPEQ